MGKQLTVSVAADRLGLTPQSIRRYIRLGKLATSRPGKRNYRISEEDLAGLVRFSPGPRPKVQNV